MNLSADPNITSKVEFFANPRRPEIILLKN